MTNFTTLVAVDSKHAAEMRLVWPTWLRFRPQIFVQPMVLLVDERMPQDEVGSLWSFLGKPSTTLKIETVPIDDRLTQRERMLRALILGARHVSTPWTLKLDTDVLALREDDNWCKVDESDGVFVSSPWGYTKPGNAIERLDDWGDKFAGLGERLNLPPKTPDAKAVATPGRIISYVFFGQTPWLKFAAETATDFAADAATDVPVWSHDTYLWWLAKRTKQPYSTKRMTRYGWAHCSRHLEREAVKVDIKPRLEHAKYRNTIINVLKQRFGADVETMGAEIGVSRGETSAVLLDAFPKLHLNLVDPWGAYEESEAYLASGDKHASLSEEGQYDNFCATVSNTAFAHQRIRISRMTSEQAAKVQRDNWLDFAFLDADHTYEAIKRDLELWWQQLKPSGLLMGHDFGHKRFWGVEKAVKEFSQQHSCTFEHEHTVFWMRKV